MILDRHDDAFLNKVFPSTLIGEAMRWFLSLTSNSIHNFTQLQDAFLEHYRHNWKKPQDVAGLFSLKKRVDETMREFVHRFRRMAAEIP
ncbi:hypothetical protein FRX31_010735 [Thalictrum thalictroides]|uniref:Retrotransposon gag domain-containing protein n=1 Tax=Thalictrum thalictroides TaxID=46969 RepID=A0A7J6WQN1_THATH|nr:hypothetical protein FRX31_010735 [Thalictrum thalictroides]